ncbi:MAG: FkbM family methyltransferase, partial [Rhodospirillales bacterium]|nr:FkbM family methyltransferase [Rhodospirillales bacterium]
FETKEPDTLEWISGFGPEEIFLDVGANLGMYTIAAASVGARVYAFEPAFFNYALLNKNIISNSFMDRVSAYCAALSDIQEWGALYLNEVLDGSGNHAFGEELDDHLQPKQSEYRQGSFSATLDGLIGSGTLPVPNHIKIDVDGFEHKVLGGAAKTLEDSALKSVLVEINTHLEEHRGLIHKLKDLGFSLSPEQVQAAIRKEGPFAGIGNHIFRR